MPEDKQSLVQVRHLVKHFPLRGSWLKRERPVVHALDDINLTINEGEVLGLVGESGCGKSTLGRCILRLLTITQGQVIYDGIDLDTLTRHELRALRREMQIVFQNPFASLNPRMRIQAVLQEPLRTHRIPQDEWHDRIEHLIRRVGLDPQHLNRYPHELSGGQCQRVAVARALSLRPRLLVLDEPTSALDVSVQAQIINLLTELRAEFKLTYLFISHDLSVIEHLSDRIGVMYLGKLVELGTTDAIFGAPKHPYTQALLASIPKLKPGQLKLGPPLEGSVPSPLSPPTGCRFHTRCPIAEAICRKEEPALLEYASRQYTACHFAE